MPEPRSKRHHYVPQFYLRRFADQKGRLSGYRRTTGGTVRITTRNAAVATGFYNIVDETGQPSDALEKDLSDLEGNAAEALRRLVNEWPPEADVKEAVADFIALQAARTRSFRDSLHGMSHHMRKVVEDVLGESEGISLADEYVRREDLDDYFSVGPNDFADMMFRMALGLSPSIARRSWRLFRSKKRLIATSDHPVCILDIRPEADRRLRGVGYETAAALVFPVDSHHVLYLLATDLDKPREPILLSPSDARDASSLVAQRAYDWVYSDPRSLLFNQIDLPVGEKSEGLETPGQDLPPTRWGPGSPPRDK